MGALKGEKYKKITFLQLRARQLYHELAVFRSLFNFQKNMIKFDGFYASMFSSCIPS